jgi:predicted nucleotide-binding protein
MAYTGRTGHPEACETDTRQTALGPILETMAAQRDVDSTTATGRRVFLVHGRDTRTREALTALLRAFDLKVIGWREASAHAGGGTPYTGDIVAAGMELADAVVVLLTPDDIGYVRSAFRMEADGPHDLEPTGQARLNVIFEAGIAMARDRMRVVLVEVGQVRKMSDIDGLNIIRMHNNIERRKDLAQRLRSAGLTVDTDGEEWRTVGDFNRPALSAMDLGTARQDAPPPEILGQDEAEYRVLCRIAEHFSQIGANQLNTPFAVPGMIWDQIAVTLRDLADAKTAAIVGINVEQLDYPAVITGLTKRGRVRLAAGR